MLSLIIDTTGAQAFIGLAENGSLLSKIIISEGRQLSKFLLSSIQSILQARIPIYIAIGTGPGKYFEDIARPGGGQPPGGDGSPARRATRPGGLSDATAYFDQRAKSI